MCWRIIKFKVNINDFRIIAIKAIDPGTNRYIDRERSKLIQKALYDYHDWLYLYRGYSINDEKGEIVVNKDTFDPVNLYGNDDMWVNICAVVGKNGAGKSSLIDLFIRIVNNLSAAIIGEHYAYNSAEHLHFIEYLYAAVMVQMDGKFIEVCVEGRKVSVKYYRRIKKSRRFLCSVNDQKEILKGADVYGRLEPLDPKDEYRYILREFFYTLVCSYSIYGFNFRDYVSERTNKFRLNDIDIKASGNRDDQYSYWLTGLFHKNDGYQTPIVIHPMRDDGHLNITKENDLAKGRLIGLQMYMDAQGNYPFRTINDDLHIKKFKISKKPVDSYDKKHVAIKLNMVEKSAFMVRYDDIAREIKEFWEEKYPETRQYAQSGKADMEEALWGYVVYKTIKIARTYRKFRKVYNTLRLKNHNSKNLKTRLNEIYWEHSHVTLKLRRALNTLRFGLYKYEDSPYIVSLDELHCELSRFVSDDPKLPVTIEDLLPPPTMIVDLLMIKGDDPLENWIPFTGLSSGERQIAYTISNFLYHLVNIDSAWDDYVHDNDHMDVFHYKYVNVIFDEVELYFHPDLQRRFVSYLTNSLRSGSLKRIKGVNVIIVTHSPFVLSDIPQSNILVMGGTDEIGKSFGANILDLFRMQFFMSSTIGEFARQELAWVFSLLGKPEEIKRLTPDEKKRIIYLSKIVGDPYLLHLVENVVEDINRYELQ